jgi:hypothetical protein
VKNRLECPIEFLETMIEDNFSGKLGDKQEAYELTSRLTAVVRRADLDGVRSWIRSISFDPEELGTAFMVVYQFAVEYEKKLSGASGPGK